MNASSHDYYRILGVPPHADGEAIKKAYRSLVCRLHPDRNPGDPLAEERFKRVQEAYAVLGTPERRRHYDGGPLEAAFGAIHFTFESEGHNGHNTRDVLYRSAFDAPTADPLDHLHTHVKVVIPFEHALRGGYKEVEAPGGEILRVTVPKGCRDHLTVRVRGKGHAGTNGQQGLRGDLLVTFRVQPHPRFRREGNHLHLVERISAVEAMLGTTRTISNPYGHAIRIAIPPGTQPGKRFRLCGQGVATRAGTGDLYVEIDVEVPQELTEEQRARLRQAARHLGLL